MKDFLAISIAAIIGTNLRYLLSRLAAMELGSVFPYGTLFINIVGSFIVGFFVIWTTERALVDPRWRLLVVVGFAAHLLLSPATRSKPCLTSSEGNGG